MSCIDEQRLDFRIPSELQRAFGSHRWRLEHYDIFGENAIIVRYKCSACGKEWTTLLIDPSEIKQVRELSH